MTDETQKKRVEDFCRKLSTVLETYTPSGAHSNSVIQPLTIHSAPREAVDIFSFPEVLRPWDAKLGWEYDQIFVDAVSYHEGHGEAYNNYGVDKKIGCFVVSRPDQYVGYVGALEDDTLGEYFKGILIPATERKNSKTPVNGVSNLNGVGQKGSFQEMNNEDTTDMTAKDMNKFGDSAM